MNALKRAASTRRRVTSPAPSAALRRHPHLYQINTWAWLERLSSAAGRQIKLADVPDVEWDRIRAQGFDLIYLLGVWQRSAAGRGMFRRDPAAFRIFDQSLPGWTLDSVVGSPFSIKAYTPDQRIGTWAALDAVRAKLHARGMRLILDFVSNHTGPDHPWITQHPHYYLQGCEKDFQRDPKAFHLIEAKAGERRFIARGRDPYFAPWTDTAQIDHFNPDARAALIDAMRNVAKHCDGLRCDMAMLVLNDVFARTWAALSEGRTAERGEFWLEAMAALPPDFIWMAEVYWDMEARLHELGFQFTYDKRLYDRLRTGSAEEIGAHLRSDAGYQSRMVRFLENHDEARSVVAFGKERLPGLAVLIATLPGLRFFHDGQFEGKAIHLPMPLNAAAREAPDLELERMYGKVLAIANDAAFHEGDWRLLALRPDNDDSHRNLLAYRWQTDTAYWLIVVNLAADLAHGRLHIAAELAACTSYTLTDELDGALYVRERSDLLVNGLYVRLHAFQAHVFRVTSGG